MRDPGPDPATEGEPSPAGLAAQREVRLPFRVHAEEAFAVLFGREPYAYWLEESTRSGGGVSLLGVASPERPSYLMLQGVLHELVAGAMRPASGTLDEALRRPWPGVERSRAQPTRAHGPVPATGSGSHVASASPLGWVGWLGYEYGAERLGVAPPLSRYPDAAMLAADRVVEISHATGEARLWFVDDGEGRAWADETTRRLRALTGESSAGDRAGVGRPASAPRWRHSDQEYLRMIAACQCAIRAGDAYQLCLTNEVRLSTAADPLAVYRRLRHGSRATHGAFLRAGDVCVLSASPELFLDIADGIAVTRPVKGTRRRGRTSREDADLRAELAVDEKERAENLMIVDLMRNDLARVSRLGGVSVTGLLEVETHRHVHQLVSTVRAELSAGADALDVIGACFPAGSMTGAPKLAAMTILRGLEGGPRGVYGGCLGRLGLDGGARLAMVIRTIVMSGGEASIGTGGGITALSVPGRELAEIRLKAAALLSALGA